MAKPKPPEAGAAAAETKAPPATKPAKAAGWRPTVRFVDYKRRTITIKLVDLENGFKPSEVAMTLNGPVATSHSHKITIGADGYLAKSEAEEKALLKLSNLETHGSAGGSWLVTWEKREMPPEQAKAELTAHQYKQRIEELEGQVAGNADLERENLQQADTIRKLEEQLKAAKGG